MANLLIVLDDVSEMIPTRIVGFPHGHRIVRKVYIAIVAEEFRHVCEE